MILSIVITTRDRKQNLLECIESIKKSDLSGIECELIVVDDASSDDTKTLMASDLHFPNSKIIHLDNKSMMVRARNLGVTNAVGDFILIIDDDNEIDPKMIKTLLDGFGKYPKYGILGPSMYYFDSKRKYLDYQIINLYTGRTTGKVSAYKTEIFDSDGVPNVFMIRRVVFSTCGDFDVELLQTFTEPDFAAKVRKRGYLCGVIPAAKTYHKVRKEDDLKARSIGAKFKQKAYCLIRNRTVYVKRYGNIPQKIIYLLFFSLFWPVSYSLLALLSKKKDLIKLYFQGYLDGLRYFVTGKIHNSLN